MRKSGLSSGNACVNEIESRKIKRDILPNHGERYRGVREQKDQRRFIEFVKSSVALDLYNDIKCSPSSNDYSQNSRPSNGGAV